MARLEEIQAYETCDAAIPALDASTTVTSASRRDKLYAMDAPTMPAPMMTILGLELATGVISVVGIALFEFPVYEPLIDVRE